MIEIYAFDREQNEFVTQEIDDAKEKKEMKLKVGDPVMTAFGKGKILCIDNLEPFIYLVGIHGFHGHSGYSPYAEDAAINAGYKGQCRWFAEYELKKIDRYTQTKENEEPDDTFDLMMKRCRTLALCAFTCCLSGIFVLSFVLILLSAASIVHADIEIKYIFCQLILGFFTAGCWKVILGGTGDE